MAKDYHVLLLPPVYMIHVDYKYCIFLTSRGALGMDGMLRVTLLLFYGVGGVM